MNRRRLAGLLFDKDGTLIDLQQSWAAWSGRMIDDLAAGDAGLRARLDAALGYERDRVGFAPGSVIIAGSPEDIAQVAACETGRDAKHLEDVLAKAASDVVPAPVCPLLPLLEELAASGLRLGVATNDAEAAARGQLAALGVAERFEAILGYDSGYGSKPGPGMCLGFADRLGLEPQSVAMVGDSTHDLEAGRAAGMVTIAVLSGGAGRAVLAPLADFVLGSIAEIPDWLAA